MGIKFLTFLLIILSAKTIYSSDNFLEVTGSLYFGFYRTMMSPLKDPVSQCQFTPSCSEYSSQCIHEFGFTKGIIMTADRLSRCSGGTADRLHYPTKKGKFIDLPSNHYIFGEGNLWSLGHTSATDSTNQNEIKIDDNLRFPFSLFQKGDYQLSILELERIKFNQFSNQNKLNLLISLNEHLQGNNLKALNILLDENVYYNSIDKHNIFLMKYILSDFMNLNEFNINVCKQNFNQIDNELLFKIISYSYFKSKNTDSVLAYLKILPFNQNQLDSITNFVTENINYKVKSPTLAAILSAVIPGTGYFYTGQVNQGLSALIINGLLGWGIYSLFDNGNTGSGILTSMVAFPFYLGNIIGSANSAEIINDKNFQVNLMNMRVQLGIDFYFTYEQLEKFWE